jgi:hypothetical protein
MKFNTQSNATSNWKKCIMKLSPALSLPDLAMSSDSNSDTDSMDVDFDTDLSDGVPSRTPSRLGFNVSVSPDATTAGTESHKAEFGTLEWTRRLFQRIKLDDTQEDLQDAILPDGSSIESDDDSSVDGSDYFSEESDSSLQQFCATPYPILPTEAPVSAPGLHALFPLRERPATTALRHDYTHHGHSKSSLNHTKWFWHARHDRWLDWEAHVATASASASAYGGIIAVQPDPDFLFPPPSLIQTESRRRSIHSNAPIYPRNGDISALRDPYPTAIDYRFCSYPLWTIHKSLFVFDMHHRAASRVMAKDTNDSDGDDSRAATPTLEPTDYFSTSEFSEEDITLVEDDCSTIKGDDECAFPPPCSPPSKDIYPWTHGDTRPWEVTWYARWELLMRLVNHGFVSRKISEYALNTGKPRALQRATPLFFIGDSDSDDDDDDDENDYGMVVAEPLFGSGLSLSGAF